MNSKPILIRITTIPISLEKLLDGQLKYMSEEFDVIVISSWDNGRLKKVADKEGVRYKSLELTRSITPYHDLRALAKLTVYFLKIKPDIVHTHTPKAGVIGMLAGLLSNTPVRVHTVAGLPLMETRGIKRRLLNFVEEFTYSCANIVLPNSFRLKDFIIQQKFTTEKKLAVLGNGSSNGIDVTHFDPKTISKETTEVILQTYNIKPSDKVILFVGRIVKDKGIEELVKAYKKIEPKNTKLVLVGEMEEELDPLNQETIQEINSNPNIIHTGWQSDVRPFYKISDFLAFPSYREGFPNVVLQAGAMGLPSIVSDINGCNEIITHNHNGLIIPPKNIEQLATAMQILLENRETYESLQVNARKTIEDNYTRDVVWTALKELYFDMLQKN